ncbi:MAG: NFACT family protein [Candidatus Coproplasma sp.]
MPQDAFTLRYVAQELNCALTGGKISKINQPEKDVLSLLIYTRSGTVKLNCDLSAKYCRLSLGEKLEFPNPEVAPNFCMLLRKHLQNAEILRVAQADKERVVYFDLRCFSEFDTTDMRLYFEIMGKYSNAILVKDGVIVGAMKTASLETGARRVTLSGAKYLPPAKQDKIAQDDLLSIKEAFEFIEGDKAKFIADRISGVAYTTACDIEELYGKDVSAEQVYSYLNDENYTPCIALRDGEIYDFKARLTQNGSKRKTLLEAQSEFYDYAIGKKKYQDAKRRLNSALSSAIKKAEKRLSAIRDKLSECDKAEDVKLCGELITANIYAVQRGMDSFEAINYYDENCGKIKIALDRRLTPSQNAQKYYKKYAKLKRTEQNLSSQIKEESEKLDYLLTISSNIECAESLVDLKETEDELISLSLIPPRPKVKGQKKNVETGNNFRRYVFDGFTVLCGRNNVQNDNMTKGLSPEDIWLHAKTFHSAHVGIICDGKKPTELAIKLSAEVCAYYSDARQNGKVPIDFTQKKNVRKPKGANTGFFEYTNFKTLLVAPNAHTEEKLDEQ